MSKDHSLLLVVLLILLLIGIFAFIEETLPKPVDHVIENISAPKIARHVRVLAHDSLQGRYPGTEGYEKSALYIKTQMKSMGLQPAFDGSYVQSVTLVSIVPDYEGYLTIESEEILKGSYNETFVIKGLTTGDNEASNIPHQFVGYGIKGRDWREGSLQNKFVTILYEKPPPSFFESKKQYVANATLNNRIETLLKENVKGVGILFPDFNYSWKNIRAYFSSPSMILGNINKSIPVMLVNPQWTKYFITQEGLDGYLKENSTASSVSKSNKIGFRVAWKGEKNHFSSANIVGILPGSDPHLKDEYLLYTAHLDHEGIGESINGDSIYNGAYDNASGCAIMMECARAFQLLPPEERKRSVVFAALTAEERGLLGSKYLAEHLPKGEAIANINLDMFLMEEPLSEIVGLGIHYSDLRDEIYKATNLLNIKLVPDPMPEQNIFFRSDHYSFAAKGVPALFYFNNFAQPGPNDSLAVNYNWFNTYYHTVFDNFREDMLFSAGKKFAQLNFLTGYLVINQKKKPQWVKN